MNGHASKSELFAALPPPWPEDVRPRIRAALDLRPHHKLVVLDDDPTGTQTVHAVPVLTTWDTETLRREFATPGPCFYVLTNSRSLSPEEAATLNREVARNLKAAAGETRFTVVSRSDSTLRGYFPLETDVLAGELGPYDATLLIPYFEAGGRYTVNDIHYVTDGDALVPAGETPFARDAAFGYRNSNLRAYVEEKTRGRVRAGDVASIGLADLRVGGPERARQRLLALPSGGYCVVNAATPADLDVFVAGLLMSESDGRRFLFRTAAQFVAARLGLEPPPLWRPGCKSGQCNVEDHAAARRHGGLVMVGSHVPKTTEQLAHLSQSDFGIVHTLSVSSLLNDNEREHAIQDAVANLGFALRQGQDVVLATSRELVTGADAAGSLAIGTRVTSALVEIVRRLEVRPRYLIAKGGITSSDIATKALGVKRALVLGQLLPGIPAWQLGPETKFPGMPYIVFPGNVGDSGALAAAVNILSTKVSS